MKYSILSIISLSVFILSFTTYSNFRLTTDESFKLLVDKDWKFHDVEITYTLPKDIDLDALTEKIRKGEKETLYHFKSDHTGYLTFGIKPEINRREFTWALEENNTNGLLIKIDCGNTMQNHSYILNAIDKNTLNISLPTLAGGYYLDDVEVIFESNYIYKSN